MAVRAQQKAWMWVLLGAAVGAGALARFPLGTAGSGLVFVGLFAAGLAVLGFPLLLAEAALGQSRRRNAVDAFGPGPWRLAGAFAALVALALAALVAMLGGWAARYAYLSFEGGFYDDSTRTFRLASQGWDALLFALGVVAVAVLVRWLAHRSPHPADATEGAESADTESAATESAAANWGLVAGLAGAALLAVLALGAWGLVSGDRSGVFGFDWRSIDAPLVVSALQQALLPGLVGAGTVASLSRGEDRALPKHATLLVLLWIAVPLAAGAGLAAFAHDESVALGNGLADPFTSFAALFSAIGATQGGVLAGLFYGALVTGSVAALVVLLDVPARWLEEASAWTPLQAGTASGLVAYLLATPLAFVAGLAADVHVVLLAVVAPLGGLLVSLCVGWARPGALHGFTFGEAAHPMSATLKPVLRFILPALLLALLVPGILQALVATGAIEAGSGGLWRLVP